MHIAIVKRQTSFLYVCLRMYVWTILNLIEVSKRTVINHSVTINQEKKNGNQFRSISAQELICHAKFFLYFTFL